MPGGNCALGGGEPGQAGRARRHPPRHVGQAETALSGVGPDHGQPELDRGDPAPGGPEVAIARILEIGRARRVVGYHAVDRAGLQPRPEQLPVGHLPDRRAALELGPAGTDLLGREGEVVRARLGCDTGLGSLGGGQDRDRIGARQVQHVHAGASLTGQPHDPDDRLDLGRWRPGPQEAGVPFSGRRWSRSNARRVLGVHDQQAAEFGDLAHRRCQGLVIEWREFRHPRVSHEALEPEDAGVVQRGLVGRVGRDRAAPEADVHGALPGRGLSLGVERRDIDCRRDRVQRHVYDRRDAAGCRCGRRRGEAFPVGPARLIDVDVGVDEAGH